MHLFVGDWTTSEDKPDPSPDSWAVILHKAHSWNCYGWNFAFWLYLHPALLYSQQYLVRKIVFLEQSVSPVSVRASHLLPFVLQVSPDVLHVRLPVFGFHYFGHHLLGGNNSALLLPPVCRGTSMFTFQNEFAFCDCYSLSKRKGSRPKPLFSDLLSWKQRGWNRMLWWRSSYTHYNGTFCECTLMLIPWWRYMMSLCISV